jgi:hypothetical protein
MWGKNKWKSYIFYVSFSTSGTGNPQKITSFKKFVQDNKHQDQPGCLLTFVLSTSYV